MRDITAKLKVWPGLTKHFHPHAFDFRCTKICHSGECSDPSTCKKRSKVYCPCKRRKEEQPCVQSLSGGRKLACDAECKKVKEKVYLPTVPLSVPHFKVDFYIPILFQVVEEKQSEESWLKEEEERLARQELERFEKQSGEGKVYMRGW